ncbi:glycosyl hydrolase 5 family protein-like [Macadamia integrifolia]|uniref:glycosyl hydrolase 5 family protein-like n=1 Tax=Macadamia integrifolia TaxID=60698 RepID=UPI001C4FD44B|nr:glycosyl hydrolase 5 family protein-like [Macadamia integrifolia]
MDKPSSLLVLVFLILSPNVFFLLQRPVMARPPLYTNSRWVVDENGQRVKLACVNWVSHLEAMVAEGLHKQPLDVISKQIKSMGFNCVRLTWSLFMVTNDSLSSLTVRQSFQSLGLLDTIDGIQVNNPSLLDLPLIQAYKVVVSNLGENKVMVILDNHISKPGWCCNNWDDNGFFGDRYFIPKLWLKGLTAVATMFNGTNNVVGMSLRNELRGRRQNAKDWYRYMLAGAEAVHKANPDVLVILSGLSYDRDFSFLIKRPVKLTFTGKLVFEVHWYAFSDGDIWEKGNPNQVCKRVVVSLMKKVGFLLKQGWPLFLSEFGVDQRGTNVNDNRYLNCFFGVAVEWDWDWALWTFVGSYYLREGEREMDETYGMVDWAWQDTRNPSFLQRLSTLQTPFQGPGVSNVRPYKIMIHPSTGLCVHGKSLTEPLRLGSCAGTEAWSYTPQKRLELKGTHLCLHAEGMGKPTTLGTSCTDATTKWETISDSGMHFSSKLSNGRAVCLDIGSNNALVTNPCKCLSRDHNCDPGSQWFKIVNSTRMMSPSSSEILHLPNLYGKDQFPLMESIGTQIEEGAVNET